MYLSHTYRENVPSKAQEAPPMGPGFSGIEAMDAARMEVWMTTANEPGADRVEFRLFDAKGELIGTRTVGGY